MTAGANYAALGQIAAALAAKQVPDLVMLSVTVSLVLPARAITPLDDLIKGQGQPDRLPGHAGQRLQVPNQQWAMPFARSTLLFYYNRTSGRQASDRGPKTKDEMDEWGAKLQAEVARTVLPHVKGDSYVAWTFQGVIWQYGGFYSDDKFNITVDSPAAIEAGNFVRSQVFTKKYANVTANSETADFIAGSTASMLSSTGVLEGVLRDAKFPVGTAFYPEKKQFGCPTGGAGLAIPESIPDANKVAAMTFLKFLGSGKYVLLLIKRRLCRCASRRFRERWRVPQAKPQFKTAIDQLCEDATTAARVYIQRRRDSGRAWSASCEARTKSVWPDVKKELERPTSRT